MVGGRLDTPRDTEDTAPTELREAYERGRRDEQGRRRRHPLGMTVTFILAAIGVVTLGLAAANGGSFQGAGLVADQGVAQATGRAAPVVRQAASDARDQVASAVR